MTELYRKKREKGRASCGQRRQARIRARTQPIHASDLWDHWPRARGRMSGRIARTERDDNLTDVEAKRQVTLFCKGETLYAGMTKKGICAAIICETWPSGLRPQVSWSGVSNTCRFFFFVGAGVRCNYRRPFPRPLT